MRTTTAPKTLLALLSLLCCLIAAPASAEETRQSADGFLHGTIETSSGNSYRGLIRWGTEEAFWDDLFNSTKRELPYLDRQSRNDRRGRIKLPWGTVRYNWNDSRQFIARFGDISEIHPQRGDRLEVVMRGGATFELDGGSNDVGARITVEDAALGTIKLEWKTIEKITFSATPSDVRPPAYRLYGKLIAGRDTFEGFIQWDSQESLSIDKLDGDTRDGDLSIEMGKIRRIEKRSSRSSRVELKDGRSLVLEGSNDVNSSIRGILVEDPRFGRVKVSWDAFESVEFIDHASSGRGYGDYGEVRTLRGKISDYDGKGYAGVLVYDLDESYSFELLNGEKDEVEYLIPFEMIRTIRPGRRDESTVTLRSGLELRLSDSQDVSESNAGVVVVRDETGREVYLPWRDIERVDFE